MEGYSTDGLLTGFKLYKYDRTGYDNVESQKTAASQDVTNRELGLPALQTTVTDADNALNSAITSAIDQENSKLYNDENNSKLAEL